MSALDLFAPEFYDDYYCYIVLLLLVILLILLIVIISIVIIFGMDQILHSMASSSCMPLKGVMFGLTTGGPILDWRSRKHLQTRCRHLALHGSSVPEHAIQKGSGSLLNS